MIFFLFKFLQDQPPTIKWIDEWPGHDYPKVLESFPCIIDNHKADPYNTFDNKSQKISFNSDTVRQDEDRVEDEYRGTTPIQQFPLDSTSCAWQYGRYWGPTSFSHGVSYDLILNEFELPGCNDCTCDLWISMRTIIIH